MLVAVAAAVALAFFVVPLIGITERANWATIWSDLTSEEARSALRLSLTCSVAAAALSILFGLETTGEHILQAVLFLLGVAIMVGFIRNAQRIEPFTR